MSGAAFVHRCPRLALTLTFAWLLAAPSGAFAGTLTLENLAEEGFSMESGGVEFSDFKVKVSGKGLDTDLASHGVTFDGTEIELDLAPGFDGKKGKVKISYTVSGTGLEGAELAAAGDDLTVKSKLKKLGKLFFSSSKPAKNILDLGFDPIDSILVKSQIKSVGAATVGSSYQTPVPVPEPATAAMVTLGLGGLAAAGRRRRR